MWTDQVLAGTNLELKQKNTLRSRQITMPDDKPFVGSVA